MMRKKIGVVLLAFACVTGCTNNSSVEPTTENNEQTSSVVAETETTQAETTTAVVETTEEETEEETENSIVDYEVSEDNVKMIGRSYTFNHVRWLTGSASGIEFKIEGKSAEIMLYADATAMGGTHDEGDENNNPRGDRARFQIFIDDELITDEIMDEAVKKLTLFEENEKKSAIIRIIKVSEGASSSLGIKAITVEEGTIEPTENKQMLIEFIGDSITCGYGVDDEDKMHHFSTSTEDATKTYAYKTAQMLDSDYSLFSFSGFGIVSGYTSSGVKQEKQTVGQYYESLGFSWSKAGGAWVKDWKWDFSKRQPDVIVINLGTNDDTYVKDDEERKQEYIDGYIDMLKLVRKNNPDTKIICALGIMGDRLYPTVEAIVELYSKEANDTNVSAFHFNPIRSDEGYAADWHPTEATHVRCANELTEYIKSILE